MEDSHVPDGDGMPQTIGGLPFMCYKVQHIARLSQPAPDSAPVLLDLPKSQAMMDPTAQALAHLCTNAIVALRKQRTRDGSFL
mmetsp:Transcript_40920/g.64904  ORF Transcript_40920/g.64904 Transcript_40920/m.64904 type:complete len:83 (+) Transcript_40920:53-301(+)